MKVFSSKRRAVPEARRKYGTPETRGEMLERLRREREVRETKKRMASSVRTKNKDEFHFAYYSVGKSMVKKVGASLDELRKALRYVDSEILRCERKLQSGGAAVEGSNTRPGVPSTKEFEEYVETLRKKRREISEKVASLGS